MLGVLFLLFTVVPLVELYFLFMAADVIGGWNTFLVVLATGVIGAFLAKSQGNYLLMNIQKKMASGAIPTDDMIQGLMVLVGGVLLVTPGFATDIMGLTFVFPLTRLLFISAFKKYLEKKVSKGTFKVYTNVDFKSSFEEAEFGDRPMRDVTPKQIKSDDSTNED